MRASSNADGHPSLGEFPEGETVEEGIVADHDVLGHREGDIGHRGAVGHEEGVGDGRGDRQGTARDEHEQLDLPGESHLNILVV